MHAQASSFWVRLATLAWAISPVLASGCSQQVNDRWAKSRPATHKAGGLVLFKSAPVAGAALFFIGRAEGRQTDLAAVAQTDAQGRFRLRTFKSGDGAVAGQHVVLIQKVTTQFEKPKNDFDAPAVIETSHLPDRYRSPETSPLRAHVTREGPNEFRFELE